MLFHLVHDARGDDDASFGVEDGVVPTRDRNAVFGSALVFVNDVVFGAYENA
jgi:hypothetical protein